MPNPFFSDGLVVLNLVFDVLSGPVSLGMGVDICLLGAEP